MLIGVLLTVGGTAIFLRYRPDTLDLSKDEPPFNAIIMPPRSVSADVFLDGGSVFISVIDRTGTNFSFAFPHKAATGTSNFNEAFYGVVHATDPGAILLKNPTRAKEIGLLLLKNYSGFSNESATAIYYHLSETTPPSRTKLLWRFRSIFK
jgi:hypothetical protein